MNARRVFDIVRNSINDLLWINRIAAGGLLAMLFTGRTTIAEIKIYTVRAAVDINKRRLIA
jgi:hypothetical protein